MILSGRSCLTQKHFQPTVMNYNSQSKKNGYQVPVLNNISMNYQLLFQTKNVKIYFLLQQKFDNWNMISTNICRSFLDSKIEVWECRNHIGIKRCEISEIVQVES